MDAKMFCAIADTDKALWDQLPGTALAHSERGGGEIIAVEHRKNYSPLITLRFDGEQKIWPSTSFDNGKTTLMLSSSLAARVQDAAHQAKMAEDEEYRSRQEALVDKHKMVLASLGIPYAGIRYANPRFRRVTHCFSCKEKLDNSTGLECASCGWILCACGSCGCSYKGLV